MSTTAARQTERLIHMTTVMEAHIKADADAFQALALQAIEVNKDLKSLLASRSFLHGTWFAITVSATFLAAVSGLIIAWFRA